MKLAKYAPRGALALAPEAFGDMFAERSPEPSPVPGDAAVVSIRGPLMKDADLFFDSYSGIRARVTEALARRPSALVLAINSPGGLVAGCFETARAIRAAADAAGVPMVAYVDGQATSAAYAMACCASRIVAPASALLGSIGVIQPLVDATGADAQQGLRVEFVTSGARKADGQSSAPITDDTREAVRGIVMAQARIFFELVSEYRGLSVEDVEALQARVMVASDAVSIGLCDEVADLDSLLATLASAGTENEETPMTIKAATEMLKALAMGDDEEQKAMATRMLAAMEGEEDDEEDKEASAEFGEEDKEDDKEEAKSTAIDGEGRALAEIAQLRAEMALERDTVKRDALIKSRPDLDAKALAYCKARNAKEVAAFLDLLPKSIGAAEMAAAAGTIATVQGPGQGERRASPEAVAAIAALAGRTKVTYGVKNVGNTQYFGVPVDAS